MSHRHPGQSKAINRIWLKQKIRVFMLGTMDVFMKHSLSNCENISWGITESVLRILLASDQHKWSKERNWLQSSWICWRQKGCRKVWPQSEKHGGWDGLSRFRKVLVSYIPTQGSLEACGYVRNMSANFVTESILKTSCKQQQSGQQHFHISLISLIILTYIFPPIWEQFCCFSVSAL